MDKMMSIFDTDEHGDPVDDVVRSVYAKALKDEADARALSRYRHASLSKPRELDDEDLCVRDGYRDIVSMMRELQLAGRTLATARAEQYDPQGSEDVDPTTRPDYSYMDAVDDARRVSERLKAQAPASQAPEPQAPEPQAPEPATKGSSGIFYHLQIPSSHI